MGERKVLNKYYSWDFDPSKIHQLRLGRIKQFEVRMMLPMSVQCKTCGHYMYQGKKFNSKAETVEGETYHGIRIMRFMMKCEQCSAAFVIRTDPATEDYSIESGVTRNFELWREQEKADKQEQDLKAEESEGNAMAALEKRVLDLQRQEEVMEALEESLALSERNARVSADQALDTLKRRASAADSKSEQLSAEDEAELQRMLAARAQKVRRIRDADDEAAEALEASAMAPPSAIEHLTTQLLSAAAAAASSGSTASNARAVAPKAGPTVKGPIIPIKPKIPIRAPIKVTPKPDATKPAATTAAPKTAEVTKPVEASHPAEPVKTTAGCEPPASNSP